MSSHVRSTAVFHIEFYEDEFGTAPVWRWLTEDLTPTQRRALLVALDEILAVQGINICRSEFGKALGKGLFELRLRQDAAQLLSRMGKENPEPETDKPDKILLRVFFHAYGDKIILLLAGYDKRRRSSPRHQNEEIERARKRLADWLRRRR